MQRLLRFALDGETDDNTALRAIIAALDRAGIIVPNTVDVTIGPKPWEEVFEGISGGSRDDFRRAHGYAEDPLTALDASDNEAVPQGVPAIIDAELVESNPVETGSDSDWQGCDGPGADAMPKVDRGNRGDSAKTECRRQPAYPPITGEAAIREAARVNRALGVYDKPRALRRSPYASHAHIERLSS